MKRFVSALLVSCLLAGWVPARVSAAWIENGLVYKVVDDHVQIAGYQGAPTEVVIPEIIAGLPVTEIGQDAFLGCSSMKSISFPSSITFIGPSAFKGCTGLSEASLPDGITIITSNTFNGCTGLKRVTIPQSVNVIAMNGFKDCTSLKEIHLPDGIERIEYGAFSGCSSLESITIPDGVREIASYMFFGCSGLRSVSIPDSVTTINPVAFWHCTSLEHIFIPKSVTDIRTGIFYECYSLTRIDVDEQNPCYSNDERGVLFNKEKTVLVEAPAGITGSYDIPEGVTELKDDAFCSCVGLTGITIPDGVTSIGNYATFFGCRSLESIVIPEGVVEIPEAAFNGCNSLTSISIPDSVTVIGADAFFQCRNLNEIEIPAGVTQIRQRAFYCCNSITELVIPDGVTEIELCTFSNCTDLTRINIPDGVTSIGEQAFAACHSLTDIFIPAGVKEIGEAVFRECDSLTGITVDEKNPCYTSDERGVLYTKDKTVLIQAPGAITGPYTIPDSVTEIWDGAFRGCEELSSVNIPAGVKVLGTDVFYWCFGLRNVSIPEGVTSIGEGAFHSCGLTEVTIPDTVTQIGDAAFFGCIFLSEISIPASVTEIGWIAFASCTGLESVRFLGDAPEKMSSAIFRDITTTVYYPMGNETWTMDVMQDYGGTIFWIPYDPNHTHDYAAVVTEPTCTEAGFTTYTCNCGDSYVRDYVDALDHDHSIVEIVEPTCTEGGYTRRSCVRCGDSYIENPTPPTHHYSPEVTAPTCTEEGFTTYTCECGASIIADFVEPLGHDLGGWYVIREPACDEVGYEQGICSRCDYTEIRTTEPSEHSYVEEIMHPTCTEQGFTTYTCECGESYVADYVDALGHEYEAGKCTRCGEEDPDYEKPVENPFTDVPETGFFYEPVMWAIANGITNGTSATTFGPSDQCMRAHVVTFLWRAAGSPEPTRSDNPFVDVKETDFYYKAVLWAVENGITNGLDATHFGPLTYCNRAQVVTFLWRARGNPAPSGSDMPFTDVAAGAWYEAPILWAVENGITNGMSADSFGINVICNRAQIVTFLYRTYN